MKVERLSLRGGKFADTFTYLFILFLPFRRLIRQIDAMMRGHIIRRFDIRAAFAVARVLVIVVVHHIEHQLAQPRSKSIRRTDRSEIPPNGDHHFTGRVFGFRLVIDEVADKPKDAFCEMIHQPLICAYIAGHRRFHALRQPVCIHVVS